MTLHKKGCFPQVSVGGIQYFYEIINDNNNGDAAAAAAAAMYTRAIITNLYEKPEARNILRPESLTHHVC